MPTLFSIIAIFAILFSMIQPATVQAQGGDGIKRQVNAESGKVSFIGPEHGRSVPATKALGTLLRPQDPGLALAKRFAPEFGVKNPERDLAKMKSHREDDGRLTVRFQQKYQGIPVMGGELIVNTNDNGDLYSMNGEVSPDLSLATQPTISSAQAREAALQSMAKWYEKTSEDFIATDPELWIFDESLLQLSMRPVELVWRMEVTGKDNLLPVRELVLVNAQRGGISLHFNQVDTAWTSPEQDNVSPTLTTEPSPPTQTVSSTESINVEMIPAPEVDQSIRTISTSENVEGQTAALTGATWYVATTGNDGNNCATTSTPCSTIQAAITKAANGDTIKVAIGTYISTANNVAYIYKSLILSGGWNNTFTTQDGASIMDGGGVRNVIDADAPYQSGTSMVVDHFVIQNGAQGAYIGSGIYISNANFTLKNSSVINNSARFGGGIFMTNGTLTILNSTISGNTSSYSGAGVFASQGNIGVYNSTIAYNNAHDTGGGIYRAAAVVNITNSIIAKNMDSAGSPDCFGSIGTGVQYSIIGNTTGCTVSSGIGDKFNVDPLLNPSLSGTLPLHTLQAASPAIDAGDNSNCQARDQRGMPRPIGAACDLGAYEYAPNGGLVVLSGSNQATANLGLPLDLPLIVSVFDTSMNPAVGVTVTFLAPATGPSGVFEDSNTNITTAITNGSGIAASAIFIANNQLGSYSVNATVEGISATAVFQLNNNAPTLSIIDGDGQHAPPGLVFPTSLEVAVLDGQGSPIPNVSVTFTAPDNGASGTFAGTSTRITTVVTDTNGIATPPTFTANALFGSYIVIASASGIGSVNFNLQNIVWYVSMTGSDSNNCQTPSTTCNTINGVLAKTGFVSGDTVLIADGTYAGSGNQVVLLNKNVHLSGGWNSLFTTQNGWSIVDGQTARIGIVVNDVASATIERFVVQNGYSSSNAGGIYNGGTLVLNNSIVQNNICCTDVSMVYGGAGISNWNTLTVNNSLIRDNISFREGGGIYNNHNSTLTLDNTTVSGNMASTGAGISSYRTVAINNSTISGNWAVEGIAGVGYAGGIYFNAQYGGTFTIKNSIVAGNGAAASGPDCKALGSISSAGYNLIGNNSDCSFSPTTGDLVGTAFSVINPHLTPLQDNGGLTWTHALINGSPAIDAGNPATCLSTDQRGVTRPVGARCDIGAYEGSIAWAPPYLIQTYTANKNRSATLPGTFICDQTDPTCLPGDLPAKAAHKYTIGTYNFYASNFGRNSIDGMGMVIKSTVHFCPPDTDLPCPYPNANWTGEQMVYGDAYGFAQADDVVAHELTHGVTQFESNLFYYYQSGAINESFSDLWGEYYDQTNGQGNDASNVKWLFGEDVSSFGVMRSMSNPPAYSDPDKMSSPNYQRLPYTDDNWDNGGVHTNSGINNKAVFLMVDGGTFNGKTVTALGWDKVGTIYYEVNINLLTSGADYSDLYYVLQQACINLIGQKGITLGDCTEVKDAIDAVEMNGQPVPNFNPDAPVCDTGRSPNIVFGDDLENGSGNWTFNNGSQVRWQYDSPWGQYAQSGSHFLYADDYPQYDNMTTDAQATLSAFVVPNNAYLHFAQAYEFEYSSSGNYDGGVLEYSINSGSTWIDAGPLMEYNGYTGTIFANYINPLRGRPAFVGTSHGYVSSRLNLAPLIGKTVSFRWRMGLDDYGVAVGWWVDNIKVYTCGAPTVFTDVSNTYWAWSYIERLYAAGITGGCAVNPLMYCPGSIVTRDQMAVFLLKGKHGPGYVPPAATGMFADVPQNYWAAAWIEQLAAEGITGGCATNPLRYCPGSAVTRDQMAIFLLKAKHGSGYVPPVATGVFADVPTNYWAATWIEQLAVEGVTGGCNTNPLRFCPGTPVTRDQMAVFLVKNFNLP
jgi:Zn-dependent metalloprotease